MYKVFLVDDEELVIKSLKARVNWSEFGFEVAGYALNGAEAFEAIARLKPDLVFTDVRMPGMSGLELIKDLKEAGSRALAIVVSGYAEFALAQKAMNYGAFGYCLKPFDEDEIIGFLKKAKAVLEDRGAAAATDILNLIEENSDQASEILRRTLSLSGIDLESTNGMKAVVSIGTSKLKLQGIRSCVSLNIGFGKKAYLIQESPDDRLTVDWNEASTNGIKGIGISSLIHKAEQIKEAIREAEYKAYEQLMEKSGMEKERRPFLGKNQTFNAIYAYINENYCSNISISGISNQFNVNANYISQLFKKETGKTFTEYLFKLRIDYACQLLTTTDLALIEIAGKAGYEDYFYFSRIFKRIMGKTPSAYRAGH
jgi:YesN/AraC family two-component response regulator